MRAARKRRPQARGVVTRERLLDAARALFSRRGYAAVSLADIAKRARCSLSTAYYHFPEKRDLLLQLIDEWGKAMPVQRRAAFDIRTALDGKPLRAARDFLQKSLTQLRRGPSFYRVILAEAEHDPEVRRRYEAASQTITAWLTELVRMAQHTGVVRAERNPEASAFVLHHVIESVLTDLVARQPAGESRDDVLDELAEMVCSFLMVGTL